MLLSGTVGASGRPNLELELEEEIPKAPVITNQPWSKIIAVIGEDLTLSVTAKGEEPLRCRQYTPTS